MNTRHLRASLSAALLVQLCSASGNGADEGWKLVQYRHGRMYVPKTSERPAFESVVMRPEERDKTGSTNAQSNGDGMVNSSVTLTLEMPTDGVYDAKSVETDTIQQSSPSQKVTKVSFAAVHPDEVQDQPISLSKWYQHYSELLVKRNVSRLRYSDNSGTTSAINVQRGIVEGRGHNQQKSISTFHWRDTQLQTSAESSSMIRHAAISNSQGFANESLNPNVHMPSCALKTMNGLTDSISETDAEKTGTGLMATAGAVTGSNDVSLQKYHSCVPFAGQDIGKPSISAAKLKKFALSIEKQNALDSDTLKHARIHDWDFVLQALSRGANPLKSYAVIPLRYRNESALMHAALAGRVDIVLLMLDSYDAPQSNHVVPELYRTVHAATLFGQDEVLLAILERVSNNVIQARMLLMPEATLGMMSEDGYSTKINSKGIMRCYQILINAAPTTSLADALSDTEAFGLDRSLAIRELLSRPDWYHHISPNNLDSSEIGRFIMRRGFTSMSESCLVANALEALINQPSWKASLLYTAAQSLRVDLVRRIYAAADARGDKRDEHSDNIILSIAVHGGNVELAEYMVGYRGLMPSVDQVLSWSRGFRNMEIQSNAAFKAVFNRLPAGNQQFLRVRLPSYLLR